MREQDGEHEAADEVAAEAIDAGDTIGIAELAEARAERGDSSGAERLHQMAADAGDLHALWRLAVMREKAGDRVAAEYLYRQATDAGHIGGLPGLARMTRPGSAPWLGSFASSDLTQKAASPLGGRSKMWGGNLAYPAGSSHRSRCSSLQLCADRRASGGRYPGDPAA